MVRKKRKRAKPKRKIMRRKKVYLVTPARAKGKVFYSKKRAVEFAKAYRSSRKGRKAAVLGVTGRKVYE